jgi:putative membrane protein
VTLFGFADPWRFQPNLEVYVLVAFLVGAYVYTVRVIGPAAVPPGRAVVTRREVGCFIGAMVLLFTASTWPIHQIGEQYLYSAHMLQHMMLSYFMPPLILLATPEWFLRTLIGNGRINSLLRVMTKPLVAGLVFNAAVVITHIPIVVNTSVGSAAVHYSLHLGLVLAALLMWMPVVGPFPELHIGQMGKIMYLFAQSVVPTIPAAWLTFAEGVVYTHYDQPVRVWGMTIGEDQQVAGAIMKLGGTVFLWTIIVVIYFSRFARDWKREATYRRGVDGNGLPSAFAEPDRVPEHPRELVG